jgi:hypothetical protein
MILSRENRNTRTKTCTSRTFFTINQTQPETESNLDHRGDIRPTTELWGSLKNTELLPFAMLADFRKNIASHVCSPAICSMYMENSMELQWNDSVREKPKYSEKNLSQ